ncbi:hypothetical protein C0Q70_01665 [Pomacea canaliculata]|uniref:Uncharacterized protein n=1 Tax=Pomacea canaliculata TaxID=400727 RepID=A0A2T7Q041_POMCA|nr:hypothetical protein C0Q70_01665 [Pomacea canaliculata]
MQAFYSHHSSQHRGTGPAFSGSTREKEDGSAADSSDSAKISKDLITQDPEMKMHSQCLFTAITEPSRQYHSKIWGRSHGSEIKVHQGWSDTHRP